MTAHAEGGPTQPNLAKRPQTANMFCTPKNQLRGSPALEPASEQVQRLEMQEVNAWPRSLDDILVKRNAELVHSIEEQQNRFLVSVREAMLHCRMQGDEMKKATKDSSSSTLMKDDAGVFPTEGLQMDPPLPIEDLPQITPRFTTEDSLQATRNTSKQSSQSIPIVDLRNLTTVHDLMRERGILGSQASETSSTPTDTNSRSETSSGRAIRRPSHRSGNSEDAYAEAKKKRPSITTNLSKGSGGWRSKRCSKCLPSNCQRKLQSLVKSVAFQTFFTGAILTNTALIGIETEYTAEHLGQEPPKAFFVLSTLYSFIFLCELLIQLLAHGFKIFWSTTWYWSWLDLFIVITSIVDFASEMLVTDLDAAGSTGQLRVMRILRVARLARVVRIMRVVKALRALRTLCYSILCTLKSLMWALVLIFLIIYVFGIMFTDAVSSHLLENPGSWSEHSVEFDLDEYFGTLHKSTHTLFQSVSGGLDWRLASSALAGISWFWAYCFTTYIAFTVFAVLNVMTGVFCQSALESAQRDQEIAVQNVMLNKQRFEDMLMSLFRHIDVEGRGRITITEFENHFEDEAFQCLLHSLELEVSDAWSLFMMLDLDDDHDIDAEDFLDGCMHLKGTAKAIDLAALKRKHEQSFSQMKGKLESMEQEQYAARKVLLQIAGMLSAQRVIEPAFSFDI